MNHFKLRDYMVEPEGKISKRMIYKDGNVAAFVLSIGKGSTLPPHTHFDCSVIIQVLKGSGKALVDGKPVLIEKDDLLEVEGKEKVAVENTGDETICLYVTLSPNPPSEQYTEDLDI